MYAAETSFILLLAVADQRAVSIEWGSPTLQTQGPSERYDGVEDTGLQCFLTHLQSEALS